MQWTIPWQWCSVMKHTLSHRPTFKLQMSFYPLQIVFAIITRTLQCRVSPMKCALRHCLDATRNATHLQYPRATAKLECIARRVGGRPLINVLCGPFFLTSPIIKASWLERCADNYRTDNERRKWYSLAHPDRLEQAPAAIALWRHRRLMGIAAEWRRQQK